MKKCLGDMRRELKTVGCSCDRGSCLSEKAQEMRRHGQGCWIGRSGASGCRPYWPAAAANTRRMQGDSLIMSLVGRRSAFNWCGRMQSETGDTDLVPLTESATGAWVPWLQRLFKPSCLSSPKGIIRILTLNVSNS